MVPEWTIHMHINTHTHIHTLLYIATHTLISIQMTFKILLSLFSRLSSFCQRFYPQVLCYRKRAQIHTHTFYDIILLVSFADFMTSVEKSLRRGRHLCSRAGPGQWASFRFCFVPFEVFHYDIAGEWTFFHSAPKFRWQFADGRQSRCFVSSIYELKFNS